MNESVTIITGASSGIGATTALKLAKAGSKIVLVARADDKIEKVRQEIEKDGGNAELFIANVTDFEQMKAKVEKYGRVDKVTNKEGAKIAAALNE